MSLYFESQKPISGKCTIEEWRDHADKMRKLLDGKDKECRDLRNESRRLRFDTAVQKKWNLYINNVKLHDRAYEIEVLVEYARDMLPKIANEKKLVEEEKFQTENLLQMCDTWISVCMEGLNKLDKKLELELTRNDEGVEETKKEIKLLEEAKAKLRNDCLLAWEMANRLEDIETKIELNLQFKKEVMDMDIWCQAIEKIDTEVSYKVEPTKGPKKMLTIEEWQQAVYGLVDKGKNEIAESMRLREKMLATRGITLNEYAVQFDKTDYALRKRIYEINKEKNESQYQLYKVEKLIAATEAEIKRLELFLIEVKNDLKCAETRCSLRFFRPSVDATIDPPFLGMNKEVTDLQAKVAELQAHLDTLKTFNTNLGEDQYKLLLETDSKNKSLQIQLQGLDIRIAGRHDPKKIYAYNPLLLTAKMITQMSPPFSLYSNKF